MTAPVIELDDVVVARGGRVLVGGVSLAARPGEVLAILGENGAGKTTLLKLMAGDVAPDRGAVRLHGRPLDAWSALEQARRRAVLPQQPSVAFGLTAHDVVLLGRSPHHRGRPGPRDVAIVRDALRRTDALAFATRRHATLSGGERARVMLARAFAQVLGGAGAGHEPDDAAPRALLLDEPSAALDVAHQHAAFDAVRRLAADEGVAVVAVLHDLNLAAAFADRVALLKHGRLLAVGGVDETLTEALLADCFSVPVRRLAHPARDIPLLVATPAHGRTRTDAPRDGLSTSIDARRPPP